MRISQEKVMTSRCPETSLLNISSCLVTTTMTNQFKKEREKKRKERTTKTHLLVRQESFLQLLRTPLRHLSYPRHLPYPRHLRHLQICQKDLKQKKRKKKRLRTRKIEEPKEMTKEQLKERKNLLLRHWTKENGTLITAGWILLLPARPSGLVFKKKIPVSSELPTWSLESSAQPTLARRPASNLPGYDGLCRCDRRRLLPVLPDLGCQRRLLQRPAHRPGEELQLREEPARLRAELDGAPLMRLCRSEAESKFEFPAYAALEVALRFVPAHQLDLREIQNDEQLETDLVSIAL